LPLERVNNTALKQVVAVMMKGGLSAKTINTYTQVLKSVDPFHLSVGHVDSKHNVLVFPAEEVDVSAIP
jgi:hypothetical protein